MKRLVDVGACFDCTGKNGLEGGESPSTLPPRQTEDPAVRSQSTSPDVESHRYLVRIPLAALWPTFEMSHRDAELSYLSTTHRLWPAWLRLMPAPQESSLKSARGRRRASHVL